MANCWRFARSGAPRAACETEGRGAEPQAAVDGAPAAAPLAPAAKANIWFCAWTGPAARRFRFRASPERPSSARQSLDRIPEADPAARAAREATAAGGQLEQRFKGRVYDWMNVRADGRGFLPDPRDPAATPPNELYVVARDGGTAAS